MPFVTHPSALLSVKKTSSLHGLKQPFICGASVPRVTVRRRRSIFRMSDESSLKETPAEAREAATESVDTSVNSSTLDSTPQPSVPSKSSSRKPKYSLRTRLREETEAPFRKARMFVYAGSAMSAAVGAFIAFLRVIAALSGVSGVQPLEETVPNVAVNLGVIGLMGLLLRFESKAGEKRLERMSRGARMANLRLEDMVTRQVQTMKDFRGKSRVVVIAGSAESVEDSLPNDELREELKSLNVIVVPLITSGSALRLRSKWQLQPFALDEWRQWFESEREVALSRLGAKANEILVVIVRFDGKVGGRSVGAPMWERLVNEVSKLPSRDKYGKP